MNKKNILIFAAIGGLIGLAKGIIKVLFGKKKEAEKQPEVVETDTYKKRSYWQCQDGRVYKMGVEFLEDGNFVIRNAIIFRADGLDEKAIRTELEKRCKVLDVHDITVGSENEEEPARAFLLEGSLAQILIVKLDFNCKEDGDDNMWPIALG